MKVRCIDSVWSGWNDTYRCVVYSGKEYDVLKEAEDGYIIRNEVGVLAVYPKDIFEEVKEVEKEKVLEVEYKEVFNGEYAVRIAYQNENVLKRGCFKDDEIGVRSVRVPEFKTGVLYILGNYTYKDKKYEIVNKEKLEEIKTKVEKINEKYGIPKRWRAEYNGKYFVIGNDGVIFEDRDKEYDTDNRRYVLGNYFKTKEEAQAKLEKIKQILKGE